jgi:hypothetical protein
MSLRVVFPIEVERALAHEILVKSDRPDEGLEITVHVDDADNMSVCRPRILLLYYRLPGRAAVWSCEV